MKKAVFAAVLACGFLSGCQGPCASMGWRYEIFKPATVNGTSIVSAQPGVVNLAGVGTGGIVHEIGQMVPPAMPPAAPQGISRPLFRNEVSTCNLDDVCRRLEALERRLDAKGVELLHRPMPKGVTEE